MDALYAYVATALDHNLSIYMLAVLVYKKHSIRKAKCTISLKLGRTLW